MNVLRARFGGEDALVCFAGFVNNRVFDRFIAQIQQHGESDGPGFLIEFYETGLEQSAAQRSHWRVRFRVSRGARAQNQAKD